MIQTVEGTMFLAIVTALIVLIPILIYYTLKIFRKAGY